MVLVLTGPGFVKQVHLGVAEGSYILYIWRRLYFTSKASEGGRAPGLGK